MVLLPGPVPPGSQDVARGKVLSGDEFGRTVGYRRLNTFLQCKACFLFLTHDVQCGVQEKTAF